MSTREQSDTRTVKSTALAEARTVDSVHRATTFHWVGNGFHVSTYFPSDDLPAERTSPFVLMDYGPTKTVLAARARKAWGRAGTRTGGSRP